jgi:hypothetical protein
MPERGAPLSGNISGTDIGLYICVCFSQPLFLAQIRFRHCLRFRHQVKYRITEAALIHFVDLISSPKRAIQSTFPNAFDLIDGAS